MENVLRAAVSATTNGECKLTSNECVVIGMEGDSIGTEGCEALRGVVEATGSRNGDPGELRSS